MRVVIASGNAGKIREFAELLSGSVLEAVAPSDLGIVLDVAETGATYRDNAFLKAAAYADASGLPALADDSGIEVEALGGSPGIYSARYGGPGLSDADRTTRLLSELQNIRLGERRARYYCALVLMLPDGRHWQAEGICDGAIGTSTKGSNGFGYDPIFFLPELGKTMAELGRVEKNRLSHRARAVEALLATLTATRAEEERAMPGNTDAIEPAGGLSHLDAAGRARMVDVTDKRDTSREAIARGRVEMKPATLQLILAGEISKGNVLTTAQIGGIMAAKRTHELIPLCHPLPLTSIHVDLEPDEDSSSIEITARVRTTAKTGVEMEALTAVSLAALTIYDMCKAVDRGIRIGDIRLARKSGGKSGEIVLE